MQEWTDGQMVSISQAFAALCEVHNKKASEALTTLYFRSMAALPAQDVIRAIEHAIMECVFFPKPVELLTFANGSLEEKALSAWTILYRAISSIGRDDSVIFEDTRISQLIDYFGGWLEVTNWTTTELDFRRTEFVKQYIAIKHPGKPKKHVGLIEHKNSLMGYNDFIQPPVYVLTTGTHKRLPSLQREGERLRLEAAKSVHSIRKDRIHQDQLFIESHDPHKPATREQIQEMKRAMERLEW